MSLPLWSTIDPHARLEDLGTFTAVALEARGGPPLFVQHEDMSHLRHIQSPDSTDAGRSPCRIRALDGTGDQFGFTMPWGSPAGLLLPRGFQLERMIVVPPLRSENPAVPAWLWWLTGGLAATGLLAAAVTNLWPILGATVALTLLLFVILRPRGVTHSIASLDGMPLTFETIADYARRRADGESPRAVAKAGGSAARRRVEEIREEYGRRKLDIVARIDTPALFDDTAPTTASFLEALWQYDAVEGEVPSAERERLASAVEVAWAVAVQHAETAGWHHAPEDKRDDLRRASKVAHLAVESPNEGERAASLHQLRRLLLEVGLRYLPTLDEIPALAAPEREDRP